MRATTVLVEGESDRLAVETLASRSGRDLTAEGIAVVAMGGVTNIRRFLERYGPGGADQRVLGLCDAAESPIVFRALQRAGLRNGFQVCHADLEDELIRFLGTESVLDVIDSQGELDSFRVLQRQPFQRDQPPDVQLRRFLSGRGGNKIRYAPLLVKALPAGQAPPPLERLLDSF